MSSSYGTNFPPLPAFKSAIASNNVYANVVDPLTVIGSGGGGGAVPADLSVSTLTVAGNGQQQPGIIMNTNPNVAGTSIAIIFNDAVQDNVNSGQLAIAKQFWPGVDGSTIAGLVVFANSTIFGSFQPVCVGDLYVNNSDGGGDGTGRITYVDAVSSLSLTAAGGGVTISSLAVSSINGNLYPPPSPGGSPNAEFSTVTTAQFVSTPALFVSSVNGALYPPPGNSPNPVFSTVTVSSSVSAVQLTNVSSINGGANINGNMIFVTNPAASNYSYPVLFNNAGQDNVSSGQLAVGKLTWSGVDNSTIAGFAVYSFSSILGSIQPVLCGDLYLDDTTGLGSGFLKYRDSVSTLSLGTYGNGLVSISSLAVSSINGALPGGNVPANLNVSTLTVTGNGDPGIIMNTLPSFASQSVQIHFNSLGQDNINSGQLAVAKKDWFGVNGSTIGGLGVFAYSTVIGSFQPVCVGDLYVNNSDGGGNGTGSISYVDAISSLSLTAAGGGVSISSAVVSSINGTNWPALVSTVIGLNGGPI